MTTTNATVEMPGTVTDAQGNYYCFFSPQGRVSNGAFYRVPPADVAQVYAMGERAANENGGRVYWHDAAFAIAGAGGHPAPIDAHPWFE